jgi:hypothetical protein
MLMEKYNSIYLNSGIEILYQMITNYAESIVA